MARGVARPINERINSLETQKAEILEKIDSLKKKVVAIDAELKKLQEEKRLREAETLLETLAASGKSLEDILALINS